jgi:hypothetical protein
MTASMLSLFNLFNVLAPWSDFYSMPMHLPWPHWGLPQPSIGKSAILEPALGTATTLSCLASFRLPHFGHFTSLSLRIRSSQSSPHFSQRYSYRGIRVILSVQNPIARSVSIRYDPGN